MLVTLPPTGLTLGNGHYIVTDASLDSDSLEAQFHSTLTCTNKIAGFTAGVILHYFDINGAQIGNSGTQQFGIGQAPVFSAGHVYHPFMTKAPPGTVAMTVSQFHDEHNRFPFLQQVGEDLGVALSSVGTAINDFGNWCDENSTNNTLCAILIVSLIVAVALATGTPIAVTAGDQTIWSSDGDSPNGMARLAKGSS